MACRTPKTKEPIVVIINGRGGVGKDSLVFMVQYHMYFHNLQIGNYSSVTPAKKAAKILGWDGEKGEKGRQFLSDLKDMSTRLYNGPIEYMLSCIKRNSHIEKIMFFHVREPEEIAIFQTYLDDLGIENYSLLVRRDGLTSYGNHADMRVEEFEYDIIIHNDGMLQDLDTEAIKLIRKLVFTEES